jgi:hypothetical protein
MCTITKLPPQSSPLGLVCASSHHYFQEVASSVLILEPVMRLTPAAWRLPPSSHSSSLGLLLACTSSPLPGGCLPCPHPCVCYVLHHYCHEVASSVLIFRICYVPHDHCQKVAFLFLILGLLCICLITIARGFHPQTTCNQQSDPFTSVKPYIPQLNCQSVGIFMHLLV